MSYVKPFNLERFTVLCAELSPDWGIAAERAEEKERMLAAIEECRFEAGPEYNKAMHTVLDVLEYLVRKA